MTTQNGSTNSSAAQIAAAQLDQTNQLTAAYFAAAILGLLALFTNFHWVGLVLQSCEPKTQGPFTGRVVLTARGVRSMLLRKVPGFTTLGHAFVFFIYLVINLCLTFHDVNLSGPTILAKRIGWIAASNIALVAFLALKNTPLGYLTSYSYERLNILHQAAGYCTVFSVVLHALLQIVSLAQQKNLSRFLQQEQIMGIVAGLSVLTILTTALFLKNICYEAFYIVHITMFILILIGIGMHRPDLADKTIYIIIFAASIWVADRLFRASRMVALAFGNRVTITPLGHNGIRISMRRAPWRAVPGSHVFLWIPKIRRFEAHPFTMASTNPLELVVSAQDGFTRDLLSYATANPAATLLASCDGPYGALPNFSKFDQVVLIAGGSGASFIFGVARHLIHQMKTSGRNTRINLTWIVRENGIKTWYDNEISELSSFPNVTITVHITRPVSTTCSATSQNDKETMIYREPSLAKSDLEKTMTVLTRESSRSESNIPIIPGRPDVAAKIQGIVACTETHEKTIVAACGPDGLMNQTRRVVAALVASQDRSVTLHCEQFGW